MNKIGLLLVASMYGCSIVGPDERGVSVSMGHASHEVLEPGPYFWLPFVRGIKTMSVLVQKTEMDSTAGTKDLQEVRTHAAINWHINPQDVVKIYTTVGYESDIERNIMIPAFNESTKQATAKRTAEEVLSKRSQLKDDIDNDLRAQLAKYGILVDDVNIINVAFSADFTKAVEAKQVAEQDAQKAVYVAKAAEQEAAAEVNHARGAAEAQRLQKLTLTPEIIKLKAIEKWDGHFPEVMGAGSLPLVDLRSKEKE